ncbi:MAG: hypothetical protein IJH39_04035 [Clostridia bacterium]|nr:hypothetical protein [Clostridia bacterium]
MEIVLDSIHLNGNPVPMIYRNGELIYQRFTATPEPEPIDYKQQYLTFEVFSAGTIGWKKNNSSSSPDKTIEYSLDNGTTWTSITSATGSSAPSFSVNAGDKILFRGNNASYCGSNNSYNNLFTTTCPFIVYGNIMSLINSTTFRTLTEVTEVHTFTGIFLNCTGLTSAENLVLPATTLVQNTYRNLFQGCTNLTTAPSELPSTTLAKECYFNMFNGCTSLTGVSTDYLPATTLAESCYRTMFYGCSGLTQAPELLASDMPTTCYYGMFYNCRKLGYIKCLGTNPANTKTQNWVVNAGLDVTGTKTFVKSSSSTGWSTGNSGIPTGWTVESV